MMSVTVNERFAKNLGRVLHAVFKHAPEMSIDLKALTQVAIEHNRMCQLFGIKDEKGVDKCMNFRESHTKS